MTQKDRIAQLEVENAALRQKLSTQLALDKNIKSDLWDAVGAVARNVSWFNDTNKERVLLAVAALYGIIGPKKPMATEIKK